MSTVDQRIPNDSEKLGDEELKDGSQLVATLPTAPPSTADLSEEKYDPAALKTAHRKLDIRLLLWYSFVYLIMRIHVGNISNTAIMNVEQKTDIKRQLHLSSGQWAWALSCFYYPYMFLEPFSTMALKKFTPRNWMTRIMVVWGICSMCQGAVQNYGGLIATRVLLGAAEAGFYPGVLYHLSFFYSPDSLPLRIGFFYACGMFSGTISGLLAYAISFMNGLAGLSGWRWLFILEGIPAVLCGIATFCFLPNYPETCKFLTDEEKAAIKGHLSTDAPQMESEFSWSQIKALFKTPSFIPFTLIWITHGIGGWGVSFVLPSVIYDLGMSNTAVAQIMTMPPYTLVFVILLTLAFLVQKKYLNAFAAGALLETGQIVCYILLVTVHNRVAKYILIMIATASGQSFYPIIWPERIRAAKGTTAVGLAIGFTNAATQLSGIVGPQIYNLKFGPTYRVSYLASIGTLCATVTAVLLSWYTVRRTQAREADLERRGSDVSSAQDAEWKPT